MCMLQISLGFLQALGLDLCLDIAKHGRPEGFLFGI